MLQFFESLIGHQRGHFVGTMHGSMADRKVKERRRFSRFTGEHIRIHLRNGASSGGVVPSRLLDISRNGLAIFQKYGHELKQPGISIRVSFADGHDFVLHGAVRRIRPKKLGMFNGYEYGIELEAPSNAYLEHLFKTLSSRGPALSA